MNTIVAGILTIIAIWMVALLGALAYKFLQTFKGGGLKCSHAVAIWFGSLSGAIVIYMISEFIHHNL